MNCSCEGEVKSGEIFGEEYGELIKGIKTYKCHLDKGQKIPFLSCEYC